MRPAEAHVTTHGTLLTTPPPDPTHSEVSPTRLPWFTRVMATLALLLAALIITLGAASTAAAQDGGDGGGDDDGGDGRGLAEAVGDLPGTPPGSGWLAERFAGGDESGGGDGGGEEGSGQDGNGGNAADEIEEPGGIGGMGIDILKGIVGFVWDWSFGWFGDRVGQGLIASMLYLPNPTASQTVDGLFDSITGLLSPVLLIGILVMSLMMMLRSYNTGVSYAGFSFLPRVLGVAIVLGALPFLMSQLSKLGADLTVALLPSGDETFKAGKEMLKAVLGQLVVGNVMNLILAIAGSYVVFVVAVVSFFKNIFYELLYVVAPFALVGSLIPGLSHFAYAWAKAVLVCAAVPAMWAAEIWLASKLIADPRAIFGQGTDVFGFISNGMFTSIIAIIMMWIMYKTPFKVLSWAFVSYDPHRGGGISSFGKWIAFSAGKQAIGQIAGAASNMRNSGPDVVPGKGGSAGAEGPKMTESIKQRQTWEEDSAGNVFNQRTQYERNREMRESFDPNTVNMKPPQGHGPTSSGTTPYSQPPRKDPDELGSAAPNSPTFYQNKEGRKTVIEQDRMS